MEYSPQRQVSIAGGVDPPAGRRQPDPLCLTQAELAQRWRLSGRTLEKWRWERQGPPHLKLGGRVVYRTKDVEAYEAAQLRGGK